MSFKDYLREAETEDYIDQIKRKIREYTKKKDAEAVVYYKQALDKSAVSAWDKTDTKNSTTWFKNSASYESWKDKNKDEIEKQKAEFKRFAHMN
jgi:hypothetical protein